MVSIAEYAKQKQVSYQAVNQQIKRYQKELKGHIHKQGKSRFLDDEAVEFLNQKRKENPVTVVQEGRTERITELEDQVKVLTARIVELQDRLIQSKDTIEQLQADNIRLLTAAAATESPQPTGSPEAGGAEEVPGEAAETPTEAHRSPEGQVEPQEDQAEPVQAERKVNRFIRAWRELWK